MSPGYAVAQLDRPAATRRARAAGAPAPPRPGRRGPAGQRQQAAHRVAQRRRRIGVAQRRDRRAPGGHAERGEQVGRRRRVGRKPHSASNGSTRHQQLRLVVRVDVVAVGRAQRRPAPPRRRTRPRACARVGMRLQRQRLVGREHLQQERQPRARTASTDGWPSTPVGSAAISSISGDPADASTGCRDGRPSTARPRAPASAPAGPAGRRSPSAIPTRTRGSDCRAVPRVSLPSAPARAPPAVGVR